MQADQTEIVYASYEDLYYNSDYEYEMESMSDSDDEDDDDTVVYYGGQEAESDEETVVEEWEDPFMTPDKVYRLIIPDNLDDGLEFLDEL
jgi:hypothetical protein